MIASVDKLRMDERRIPVRKGSNFPLLLLLFVTINPLPATLASSLVTFHVGFFLLRCTNHPNIKGTTIDRG